MGRAGWYSDHPPTCSCVECTEKRLKEPMGELGKNPIERKFLDLKREVRRLLTSHMADFDISALKKRAGKT